MILAPSFRKRKLGELPEERDRQTVARELGIPMLL
jgi:hypothetical protein